MKSLKRLLLQIALCLSPVIGRGLLLASPAQAAVNDPVPTEQALKLAWNNHCNDAMPLLDSAMTNGAVSEAKKRDISYAGVMCSMVLHQESDTLSFLSWLQRHFPNDPDILFLAVNVYSELSDRNSKDLLKVAPESVQVVQLNAQNFERHGDTQSAIEEYRVLLKRSPNKPGIHYRIGGLLLSGTNSPQATADARREFEEELKIDPQAAGAEYYLGELDRRSDNFPSAIARYQKAISLQPEFAEAYLGLGRSYLDSDQAGQAVTVLEKASQLAPGDSAVHFSLGGAYARLNRKEDAAREYALQKETARKTHEDGKRLQKNIDGANLPVSAPQ